MGVWRGFYVYQRTEFEVLFLVPCLLEVVVGTDGETHCIYRIMQVLCDATFPMAVSRSGFWVPGEGVRGGPS